MLVTKESNKIRYWELLNQDPELKDQLMNYPRLAKGLKIFPYKKGIAILGIESLEVFEGFGIRTKFNKFLPLLDGMHSVDTLIQDADGISSDDRKELIANLFLCGFLRNGVIKENLQATEKHFEHTSSYTLINDSGVDSLDKLKSKSLSLCAPDNVQEILQQQYFETTGKSCHVLNLDDELPMDTDLLLVILNADCPDPSALFDQASRRNCMVLNVEIATGKVRLGPLVLPQRSACYQCYLKQYRRLSPSVDRNDLIFWGSLVMQKIIAFLAEVNNDNWVNSFLEYTWINGRQLIENHTVARLHSWNENGDLVSLSLNSETNGFDLWKRYCDVALQSFSLSSPKAYHNHYKSKNITAAYERIPVFYTGINLPLENIQEISGTELNNGLNKQSLSALLQYSLGFGERYGTPHRFCPTGGNLGSTLALVLIRDVEGIPSGVYWYDSQTHSLESLPALLLSNITSAWELSETSKAFILSISNTNKIAHKYGGFSYNISWYDAGVLCAYIHNLTNILGIHCDDLSIPDQNQFMKTIGLNANYMMVTGVYTLDARDDTQEKINHHGAGLTGLIKLINSRRACREWENTEFSIEFINQFIKKAELTRHEFLTSSGYKLKSSLLLVVKLSDAEDGFYQINDQQQIELIKPFHRNQHYKLLSQKNYLKHQ